MQMRQERTMRDQTWIGVTSKQSDATWIARWTQNYLDRINDMGAVPVILAPDALAVLPDGTTYAPDAEGRLPVTILAQLDGLVLAGGGDVDPSYYAAVPDGTDESTIDRRRDELELALARRALADDLPIFGICRGCQVLNVAAGGRLVQHIPGHRSHPDAPISHTVSVVADLPVDAFGTTRVLEVNTYHHQGVDRAGLADGFEPVAFADPDKWLIEAYASSTQRWVLGVQWHPERLFELPGAHASLWQSFAQACRTPQPAR
jgi:gamma-glutamyl-gamma-aminobutyrate hydrolase PuuD